jgi:hypothetical protein
VGTERVRTWREGYDRNLLHALKNAICHLTAGHVALSAAASLAPQPLAEREVSKEAVIAPSTPAMLDMCRDSYTTTNLKPSPSASTSVMQLSPHVRTGWLCSPVADHSPSSSCSSCLRGVIHASASTRVSAW